MKKSGTKTPHIELEEIGPSADLVLRRSKLASSDLFKTACRTPAQAKVNIPIIYSIFYKVEVELFFVGTESVGTI